MKTFINDHFLLASEPARILYHEHAKKMPLYDYHCHLNPNEILQNRQFDNLAQAWLGGDHYKWRLLRAHGVSEDLVTGKASDEAKFRKWAEILPMSVGNPIYHWTHLELMRFFDIDDLESDAAASFQSALSGETISQPALDNYQAVLLDFLGVLYAKLGFTMQLHMGVLRNLNTAAFQDRGSDMGYDSIGSQIEARSLATLLDRMAQRSSLPRTILYSLNPADNDKLATIAGCFQTQGVRSHVQIGSAW